MSEFFPPTDQQFVYETIQKILPRSKIIAFGSRMNGKAKQYSDLDIAVDTGSPIALKDLSHIKSEFANSSLLYKVDVVDFARVSTEFQKIITDSGVVIRS